MIKVRQLSVTVSVLATPPVLWTERANVAVPGEVTTALAEHVGKQITAPDTTHFLSVRLSRMAV
jgi:hypothetical protein